MTDLVLNWFQATWGREVLRQKVEALQEKYSRTLALAKQVIEVNKAQASALENLEASNRELTAQLTEVLSFSKVIDPNAQCPNCGHRKGHLTHVAYKGEVRCVNNCDVCGLPFVSAEPIAGAEAAAAAYQAPMSLARAEFRE